MSKTAIIRDAIKTKVETNRGLGSYTFADFDTEATYYPTERLEDLDLTVRPQVKFVAMGFDEKRNYRDPTKRLIEVSTQIAILQKVVQTDTSAINDLVSFVEEIIETCADDELVIGESFTWDRVEALKDQNGVPFSYDQLSQRGVFQAVFTSFYKTIRN